MVPAVPVPVMTAYDLWVSEHRATVDLLKKGKFREGSFLFKMKDIVDSGDILTRRQLEATEKALSDRDSRSKARTSEGLPTDMGQSLTPGVYERPDGEIFVVKPTRPKEDGKRHLYAKKLVEIGGRRLTETGSHVQIDFEYAPGAIRTLSENMRMPFSKAKELGVLYGRCINCGRFLKDAKSVEAGIGPVCAKAFAGYRPAS